MLPGPAPSSLILLDRHRSSKDRDRAWHLGQGRRRFPGAALPYRPIFGTIPTLMTPATRAIEGTLLSRQKELGRFLSARRSELRPEDVGLESRGRRRVTGLRRHEVADLAGVSVTWYTWLEQGRDIHVSIQALDAVSRALRQDSDEWRYMRSLAGIPVPEALAATQELRKDLREFLDDLSYPACATTGPSDLIGWNAAFSAVFGDPADLPPARRNTQWLAMNGDLVRNGSVKEDEGFGDSVARLRAEAARYPGDPRFEAVVQELCGDEKFRAAWNGHQVRQFHGPHVETVHLACVGEMRFQEYLLRPVDEPALTLIMLKPADNATRRRLAALLRPSCAESFDGNELARIPLEIVRTAGASR
jgi:transcriptional regulator with XRE-family HTH domain